MAIFSCMPKPWPVSRACAAESSAAPATRIDAPPPKPLSSPTISGIEVILTLAAINPPASVPTAAPIRMYFQVIGWPTTVATMAIAMPSAPTKLPRTAVRGWAIHFRSKMKRTAASR